MSNSSWLEELALGCLVVLSIAFLGYGALSSDSAENQQSWEYYQRCAQQTQAGTIGYNPTANEPVTADAQRQRENQEPDWCDLAAQQSMAESTLTASRAAIIGAWLTASGLVLLLLTLLYTRRTLEESSRAAKAAEDAVEVTREIGRAEVRAYLSLKEFHIRFDSSGTISFKPIIENNGNSPAIDVETCIKVTGFGGNDTGPWMLSIPTNDIVAKGIGDTDTQYTTDQVKLGLPLLGVWIEALAIGYDVFDIEVENRSSFYLNAGTGELQKDIWYELKNTRGLVPSIAKAPIEKTFGADLHSLRQKKRANKNHKA
jgi:hypothetical protein